MRCAGLGGPSEIRHADTDQLDKRHDHLGVERLRAARRYPVRAAVQLFAGPSQGKLVAAPEASQVRLEELPDQVS